MNRFLFDASSLRIFQDFGYIYFLIFYLQIAFLKIKNDSIYTIGQSGSIT